jgi:dienelactone hydrolase
MILFLLIAASFSFVLSPTICAAEDAGHRELLAKHYRLEKPKGSGPFPGVMLVPGCSGFNADFGKGTYDAAQRRLVESGFVTVRVDYLAARNVGSCQPSVSPEQVAGDICITAEYLRQQPFVKKAAINVIGWSFGASSTLQALGRIHGRDPAQVNAVVAYYPVCDLVEEKWDSEVPVLVLVGSTDNVAPLRNCNYLFRGMPEDKLSIRVYDDAHHGFDYFELPAEKPYEFGTIGYNEAAAKAAWLELTNFLRK